MKKLFVLVCSLITTLSCFAQVDHELEISNDTDCDIIVIAFGVEIGAPGCTGSNFFTDPFVIGPGVVDIYSMSSGNFTWSTATGGPTIDIDWEGFQFFSGCTPISGTTLGCNNNNGEVSICTAGACMYITCGDCMGQTVTPTITGTTLMGGLNVYLN